MKRINLFSIVCSICLFGFSQQENQNSNQSTYSHEPMLNGGSEDNTEFNGFKNSKSDVNYPNSTIKSVRKATEHRSKAIWADNSTMVSDEKTGYHTYIPYPYVSEDDILWAKRVRKWIDIRIPQNHPLYFPVGIAYSDYNGWSGSDMTPGLSKGDKTFNEVLSGIDARKNLFQILRDAATTIDPKSISPSSPYGAPLVSTYNMSLTRKLTMQEQIPNWGEGYPNAFGYIEVPAGGQDDDDGFDDDESSNNSNNSDDGEEEILHFFEPNQIVGYYLEEEIFFDKRRAQLDFRYVSITPVVEYIGGDDPDNLRIIKRELPTFYFPEIRKLLANHKVFPLDGNIAERMSFDEFFHRKYFASNIVKETNVYDRQLSDFLPGRRLDQLLEGEKIKEQIRRYESDMWNY